MASRLKVNRTHASSQISIFDIDDEKENVNATCPAVASIRILSSEAKLMILRHLLQGPKGFNELLRASGINSKTLSFTLKSLEEDKIVIRAVLSTRPFAVRYSLSPAGFDLAPVFEAMGEWGRKWLPNLAKENQNA